MTMDRQCASGLMAIATAAKGVMTGELGIAVAGGLESISLVQNKHKNTYRAVSQAALAAHTRRRRYACAARSLCTPR